MKRGRPLLDNADANFSLIYGPSTPTPAPYNSSATPNVLDNVITNYLLTLVYLTTCSALSPNHLPILIDTRCQSSTTLLTAQI
jgi:hypothetical protein